MGVKLHGHFRTSIATCMMQIRDMLNDKTNLMSIPSVYFGIAYALMACDPSYDSLAFNHMQKLNKWITWKLKLKAKAGKNN
jgi:hypothetical protein